MRRFLIDTDTASDDAVALAMALRHPDVRVEAITVVAGNVPLDQGVQNALYTVEMCGRDSRAGASPADHVDVYRGAAKPLLRPLGTAQKVHGVDGMGDIGLPLSGRQPAAGHAVDVIRQKVRESPGELELVCLGPLTNVALALSVDPEIAELVPRCVVMGGTGDGPGNVTPAAEYNVWADPEAARIVLEPGLPVTLVGWDISCRSAVIDAPAEAEIRDIGTELASFTVDIQGVLSEFALRVTKLAGFDLPDPIAMAVAIDPSIAKIEPVYVTVTTGDGIGRGQTIVDWLALSGREPNTVIVREASREHFLSMLHQALRD